MAIDHIPMSYEQLALLMAHALNELIVLPQSVNANDKLALIAEIERLWAKQPN